MKMTPPSEKEDDTKNFDCFPRKRSLVADRCIIPVTKRESTEVNFLSKKSDVVSEFAVDLSFAITYHKVQGKTVPRLVLDLNRTPSAMSMTAAMLYVGLTRVTNSKTSRYFPSV